MDIPSTSRTTKFLRRHPPVDCPEDGILIDGYYFHHRSPRRLFREHTEKLKQHGIHVKKNRFEKTEDDTIIRNWQRFSNRYKLEFTDAVYYAVWGNQKSSDERTQFVIKKAFWPNICAGLPHRTAESVGNRLKIILDPVLLQSEFERPFTVDEDIELLEKYTKLKNVHKVSRLLRRTVTSVKKRLRHLRSIGFMENYGGLGDSAWAWSYAEHRVGRTLIMPDRGVYSESGDLFHHVVPFPLNRDNIERLMEYNISIPRERFSEEEDEIVIENWKTFATEYKLSNDMAAWLAGFREYARYVWSEANKPPPEYPCEDGSFVKRTRFWPRICKGLPQRCAYAIKYRLLKLVDPVSAILSGSNTRLSIQDQYEAESLYKKYGRQYMVATIMRKPLMVIAAAQSCFRKRNLEIRIFERRKLWSIIDKMFSDGGARSLVERCLKGERSALDINAVSRALSRTKEVVSAAWNEIVDEFGDTVLTTDEEWDIAIKEIIPPPTPIVNSEFADFVDILERECLDLKLRYLRLSTTDSIEVEREMLSAGITGFYSRRFTELRYCLMRLRCIVKMVRDNFLHLLALHVGSSEILKSISRTLRSDPNATDTEIKADKFAYHFVEYMKKARPDWEIPKKLLRYVEKRRTAIESELDIECPEIEDALGSDILDEISEE